MGFGSDIGPMGRAPPGMSCGAVIGRGGPRFEGNCVVDGAGENVGASVGRICPCRFKSAVRVDG